ncbi:MAG: PQQ-binding-like beta-propeller repeat protein [candidate division WOR-3 bacterium]|nr:PQQ-binding-like beta-propeller repeat protein [candidate division WOR-3 bacterium]
MRKSFLILFIVILVLSCPRNRAPETPQYVKVPQVVLPGVPDTFEVSTVDDDGDEIRYRFNFGDGTISEFGEYLPSGDTYKAIYTYRTPGDFYVRAQAQDRRKKNSGWSDQIKVYSGLGRIIWQLPSDDDYDCEVNSTAAVDDANNIYVGCIAGHIHALTAIGNERWRFSSNNEDEFISSPVVAPNGSVYCADRGGYLYRLNSATGAKQREVYIGEEIVATPAIINSNKLFINTLGGLYAYSENLDLLWRIDSIFGVSSVVIDELGYLYVGTESGYFYSLDTLGNIRWRYNIGDEVIASPVILGDGKIAIGAQDGRVYIFDRNSGFVCRSSAYDPISATLGVGSDGKLYAPTEGGRLVKLNFDGTSITEEWTFTTDGYNTSSPAIVRIASEPYDIIYFKVSWAKKAQEDVDSLYMIRSNNSRIASAPIPQCAPSDEGLVSSPMVLHNGFIVIGAGIDENDEGGVVAVTARGTVALSPWPLFRGNRKNTGSLIGKQ